MIYFELFFSKSNQLPAIYFNNKVHVAEQIINYGVPTRWEHRPEESPSWIITGEALQIEIVEDKKLISIK